MCIVALAFITSTRVSTISGSKLRSGAFTHEQVRFGAEAVNHGQFNGNIARADYRYALRQCRQFEETVESIPYSTPGNLAVSAVGGDSDMIGGNGLAVDFHGVGIDKAREPFDKD